VVKVAADRELVDACRAAMRGERFLYAGAMTPLIEDFLSRGQDQPSADDPLTHREQQVVKLLAEGYRSKEIAAALVISEKTVERHRANILEKLEIPGRVELTRYAVRRGLIEPEAWPSCSRPGRRGRTHRPSSAPRGPVPPPALPPLWPWPAPTGSAVPERDVGNEDQRRRQNVEGVEQRQEQGLADQRGSGRDDHPNGAEIWERGGQVDRVTAAPRASVERGSSARAGGRGRRQRARCSHSSAASTIAAAPARTETSAAWGTSIPLSAPCCSSSDPSTSITPASR